MSVGRPRRSLSENKRPAASGRWARRVFKAEAVMTQDVIMFGNGAFPLGEGRAGESRGGRAGSGGRPGSFVVGDATATERLKRKGESQDTALFCLCGIC